MLIDENIYRTNGFRILGLDITSSNTKIENRVAQIDYYRATKNFKDFEPLKGALGNSKMDFLLPVRPEPSYNEYQNARNRLYDVERRFIDEIFWFWPKSFDNQLDEEIVRYLRENKYSKAIRYWEKESDTNSVNMTSIHNLAVLYHVRALDGFFEGKGNKKLFSDLELSLNYWSQLLNSNTFKNIVKERADSLNDPRLNEAFVDNLFNYLPENLLNINYIYIRRYLNSEKMGKRKEDYVYKYIDNIMNSPFDKAVISRFSSKIIDILDKRIKEYEKPVEKTFDSVTVEEIKSGLLFEYYDKVLPYLKILHESFRDDFMSDSVLNNSCKFIYYKIPTASNISSYKVFNENKYNKFLEMLENLDEYNTNRKLSDKIRSDLSYLKPLEAVEYAMDINVFDYDGNALSGVDISLTNIRTEESFPVTTDSDGFCKISKLPYGKYYYKVNKKGYDSLEGTKKVHEDSKLNVKLKKIKPKIKEHTLNISITDENSTGLNNTNISLTHIHTDKTYNITTNTNGTSQINKLPPGKYKYKIEKEGYETHEGTKNLHEDFKLNIKLKKVESSGDSDSNELSGLSYSKELYILIAAIVLVAIVYYATTNFL